MKLVDVTEDLQRRADKALENPYRFERTERYALGQVVEAGRTGEPVDKVFLDAAREALERAERDAPGGRVEQAA